MPSFNISTESFLSLDAHSELIGHASFNHFSNNFWGEIKTSNDTWKTTLENRLNLVDDALFKVIEDNHLSPTIAMDVAISSGATTLDWYRAFMRHGMDVRIIAIDRVVHCYVVRLNRWLSTLIEQNGHVLRFDISGRGYRPWRNRRDYFTGAALPRILMEQYIKWQLRKRGLHFPIRSSGTSTSLTSGPYQMIVPELRNHPQISVVEEDVLTSSDNPYPAVDVIRLANVLQHGYFNDGQIQTIVKKMHSRCRLGGLIVVCRNTSEGLEGSIFSTLPDGRFNLESRLGAGSEVEPFFLRS
ncbi:hypothetical protein OOZ54_07100 [Rhodopseudomonas palustris]|uniref:hypothetical protein n=1 Tax=Rhodopseudomonas palustris TaxID=1076 RepID=UPI0022F0FA0A|nr:hypothetical protein [Rhodopseudomonas palustris]WBU31256.1 hypothetical protein OOZ54_07100 [Rhodopseudomonas palustris]